MRENRVKSLWAAGQPVLNGWVTIADATAAEVMAHEPFDSLTVDCQHAMIDFQAAVGCLQAISTTAVTPMARVPWNDPVPIMKLLDAGAYGIICPMINTRADCEKFVGACRYAPQGYRSFGPPRGLLYGGPDYAQHANATVLRIAMIETKQALDNLDAILSVEGLDGLYVGPSDLSLSLGIPLAAGHGDTRLRQAFAQILDSARRHNIAAGIHCPNGAVGRDMIGLGFQLVTIAATSGLIASGSRAEIKAARG